MVSSQLVVNLKKTVYFTSLSSLSKKRFKTEYKNVEQLNNIFNFEA